MLDDNDIISSELGVFYHLHLNLYKKKKKEDEIKLLTE
jgi:hypothetical protein